MGMERCGKGGEQWRATFCQLTPSSACGMRSHPFPSPALALPSAAWKHSLARSAAPGERTAVASKARDADLRDTHAHTHTHTQRPTRQTCADRCKEPRRSHLSVAHTLPTWRPFALRCDRAFVPRARPPISSAASRSRRRCEPQSPSTMRVTAFVAIAALVAAASAVPVAIDFPTTPSKSFYFSFVTAVLLRWGNALDYEKGRHRA